MKLFFKILHKRFWTRNIILVCTLLVLTSILMYLNQPKQYSFLPKFKGMVSDTDKTIQIFGLRYSSYLSGNSSPAEFKEALINFQDDLISLNEGLENLKPNKEHQELYKQYLTGISLVKGVVKYNLENLTDEILDADLVEEEQVKIEKGLSLINQVKKDLRLLASEQDSQT